AATNGGLTPANKPTANNTLGLDIDANDVGYIATIQLGTPPQDFKILMDSGSADFWVGSENCQAAPGGGSCGNHTFLGPNSSGSFAQSNQPFNVTYGSGAVLDVLCQDNVGIAGLQLNAHTFGVTSEETVQFSSDTVAFDGLMGLAQSTLSNERVPTPVDALASNGLIALAITSFKISRLADQLNDGEVTFGGLDSSKFDANTLVTIPNVSKLGFWEGAMDAITVSGQDSGVTGRTAILDTGTTLIIAPAADTQAV
ncbi:acid protease, partial [Rhizopogon salebrosus TDB-379]